MAASKPTS